MYVPHRYVRCTVYPLFEQKQCVLFLRVMCCYYSAVLVVVFVVAAAAAITALFPPTEPLISVVRSYFTHSGYFKTIAETQTNINCSRHVHIRTITVLFILNAVFLFVLLSPSSFLFLVFVTPLHLIWSAQFICVHFFRVVESTGTK